MGNNDGIVEGLKSIGTNKTVKFKDGYFSFAFGNEIALCINGSYYIYNCTDRLFDDVKMKVKEYNGDTKKLILWWISLKDEFELNDYSNDFTNLK